MAIFTTNNQRRKNEENAKSIILLFKILSINCSNNFLHLSTLSGKELICLQKSSCWEPYAVKLHILQTVKLKVSYNITALKQIFK